MRIQLLPSTIEPDGSASPLQHLASFILDDKVALDAGSLAMSANSAQRKNVRDVVLTHAHLDHIAGLPLFIDDLFATLESPICVYGHHEVIKCLDDHIFNWQIYPRFSDLTNDHGSVLTYATFETGETIQIAHFEFQTVAVNHKVPTVGFIISDGHADIAFTSDTSEMSDFWLAVNKREKIDAVLIECAFPNGLSNLAAISHHLTPRLLEKELAKLEHDCPVYVINIKPAYRKIVVRELENLARKNLKILEVGRVYEW